MQLTIKQEEGLKTAVQRFHAGERYTVISGYAGTGKSTLVQFIIEALGLDENEVIFTAYTGKATQVLQKKGNKNTSTLHKLLYQFYIRADGTFGKKENLFLDYPLVIVDECSMVPQSMVALLAKHPESHFIFLGDPEQLPPIDKSENNGLLDHPHIFLDEIMRQAAESEIIQLSMKVRRGESLQLYRGKDVQVLSKEELSTGMLQWADQVLVATNAKRIALNNQMRELLGRGDMPEDGDKVICLRNYWEFMDENENGVLINGTIGTIHDCYSSFIKVPGFMCPDEKPYKIDTLVANFKSDTGDNFGTLTMDKKLILTGEGQVDRMLAYKMTRSKKYFIQPPMEFTYGYAITGHKAQGSEWDKVLVIEETFPFNAEEHRRWLYTCVTRASEKLVLIKK